MLQIFTLFIVSSFVVEYLSGEVLNFIAEGGYFWRIDRSLYTPDTY